MGNKAEVSDFLRTRRERLTPELSGLPVWGGNPPVDSLGSERNAAHLTAPEG